jgi:predicted transcriptional regulator
MVPPEPLSRILMATTSLKLPDELKEQAALAARRLGISPHAFMVEAIRNAAAAAEERARFVASAQAARRAILKSGKGFDGAEVHAYIRARAAGKVTGKAAGRPKVKSWRV